MRFVHETKLEKLSLKALSQAKVTGSASAMAKAKAILKKAGDPASYNIYKTRCLALSDSLFRSIGGQVTIKKHGAAEGRGNFIDNIDVPLNDAPLIIDQLQKIAALKNEKERLEKINDLLHRTDPGKGGIYTNFGTPPSKPYVMPGAGWWKDPGGLQSAFVNFGVGTKEDEWVHEILPRGFSGQIVPKAWMTQNGTLYEEPLNIQYKNLDPTSSYQIRLAYTGRLRSNIKLTANGHLVHDFMLTGDRPIYTFDIPKAALLTGDMTFTFICPEGEQGAQVSEIWIMKKQAGL